MSNHTKGMHLGVEPYPHLRDDSGAVLARDFVDVDKVQRLIKCYDVCAGMDDPAAEIANLRSNILSNAESNFALRASAEKALKALQEAQRRVSELDCMFFNRARSERAYDKMMTIAEVTKSGIAESITSLKQTLGVKS